MPAVTFSILPFSFSVKCVSVAGPVGIARCQAGDAVSGAGVGWVDWPASGVLPWADAVVTSRAAAGRMA